VKEAKEPTQDLEKRVADLERKILESYDKRIEDIEKGNKVTQRAILALLEHAIDGNNKNQLIKAKDNLNDYLTDR
jgi:predicted negative regulator of RcsB-dependent stress response